MILRVCLVLVAMLSVLELPVDASAGGVSDLSIAVSGPAGAGPGTTVTYEVAYANAGPDPTDAAVSVAIPDGLRLYRVVNGAGPCAMSIDGRALSCLVASLGAGTLGSMAVAVTATAEGSYPLTFVVESPGSDPDISNNQDTAVLAVGAGFAQADLSTSLRSSGSPRAGETTTIFADVGNAGPDGATGVVERLTLSWGLNFQPEGSDSRCTASSGVVSCAIGSLDAGAVASPLAVGLRADSGGSYLVTAWVSGGQADQAPDDNGPRLVLEVLPAEADMSVGIGLVSPRPLPGQPASFILQVANAGPSTATTITALVAFPEGWTADAASSDGRCTAVSTSTLRCSYQTQQARTVALLGVTGIPSSPGTATVSASVGAAEPDPNPANNQAATQVTVFVPSADVTVGLSGPSQAEKKEPFTYLAVVSNDGPDTAQAVLLTESWTFDDNERVQLSGFNTTQGSCVPAGAELSCSLGDLTTGASVTVTVTLTSTGNDRLTDTAAASAATQDPNLSNNTATVVTSID